jgi:DNA-binding transcriptional LysR family regulator
VPSNTTRGWPCSSADAAAGTTLARHAREVLTHAARLEGAVASYSRRPAAPLTLLAGGSAMYRVVPQALITFLRG